MHHRKTRRTLLPSAGTPIKRGLEEDVYDVEDVDAERALDFGSVESPNKGSPGKKVRIESKVEVAQGGPKAPLLESPRKSALAHTPAAFAYPFSTQWEWVDTIVVLSAPHISKNTRYTSVAGFDFENTLIKKRPGHHQLSPAHDWELAYPEVPLKLKTLASHHSKRVVIFANSKVSELESLRRRLISFVNTVALPIEAYVSVMDDHRAIPHRVMWDVMINRIGNGAEGNGLVYLESSLYCGSEAGRSGDGSSKARRFAGNCGVSFYTPEELFLGEAAQDFQMTCTPPPQPGSQPFINYTNNKGKLLGGSEIIVLVGPPGAGKSTFARKYLLPYGYSHVNQEKLGTREKCVSMVTSALEKKQRVVVDNTNPSKAVRDVYLQIAQRYKVPIRCFWFETDIPMAKKLNKMRSIVSEGVSKLIPDVAYSRYTTAFDAPSMNEAFDEIRAVRFTLQFETPEHHKAFNNIS